MITDHAILLKDENVDEILRETPASEEAIHELLKDMREMNEDNWYIIFYRLRSGIATWVVLDKKELMEQYNLESVDGRFLRRFEKILA